jgi:hypothetical protein
VELTLADARPALELSHEAYSGLELYPKVALQEEELMLVDTEMYTDIRIINL